MVKKKLFNFSGHPLPEDSGRMLSKYDIVDYVVPNADLATAEKAVNSVIALMGTMVTDHSPVLKTGEYEIVLPGMSTLAIIMLTTLHGFSGHFPTIRWNYRTEDGFKVSEALDLQKIRLDARSDRFFV